MEERTFLEVLGVAERLKDATRHCYTSGGRHESVAEHSWRAALMAYFLRDEFPEADMDKVIKMCLIHDLGECFTGDIPTFDKTKADEVTEELNEKRYSKKKLKRLTMLPDLIKEYSYLELDNSKATDPLFADYIREWLQKSRDRYSSLPGRDMRVTLIFT